MAKPMTQTPIFNTEVHVKELSERFARLIKNFGERNKKGTDRYQFEVDFAYALNEIHHCPNYMKGKMFDRAASIVNGMIGRLKTLQERASTPA